MLFCHLENFPQGRTFFFVWKWLNFCYNLKDILTGYNNMGWQFYQYLKTAMEPASSLYVFRVWKNWCQCLCPVHKVPCLIIAIYSLCHWVSKSLVIWLGMNFFEFCLLASLKFLSTWFLVFGFFESSCFFTKYKFSFGSNLWVYIHCILFKYQSFMSI